MIRNPYDSFPHGELYEILKQRVRILSEYLSMTRDEIISWSIIYTMVATTWSYQDHGEVPESHVHVCEELQKLKKNPV